MAFDDAFGSGGASGQDQLRQSLLEQYQPDDNQPFSVEPRVLTDRLARKLSMRPTSDANVDFNVAPEKPKESSPDLSSFGTKVKEAEQPEPSTDDLSKFGTKVEPEGPPQPPLTIMRQGAAALKGIPHGAISAAGGVLKGAGAVYDNGIPEQPETPQYDAAGNVTGMTNPAAPAVPAKPLQDRTLYKAGQATQDFAQTVAPMTDQEKQSVGGRIGTGAGALAVYGAATLAAGPLVGLPAAATGMALDTYGSVFEASKAAGKTDDEAAATAGKSALAAGVLGSLPLGAGKYAQSLIAKMAVSSAAFATLGEAQEAILQEIAKDYDPKAGYTFDQKRLIAELILGAGMGGLHHAFERGQPQPQPAPGAAPPGATPGVNPGLPPGGPGPGAGAGGPQPGAGPRPNGWPGGTGSWGSPPPGGGAGPHPGAGPQPGPNPGASGPGQQQGPTPGSGPGKPPPGTGTGKAGEAGYTMDPATRAKMERVYRHFEQGKDPSGMSDGELFDAVNEHLRDTSSTGHTAQADTPEEKAQREQHATEKTEREELIKRGWNAAWVNAMTPEQRQKALNTGRSKAGATASENTTKQPESATTSSPDKVVADDEAARKAGFRNADEVGPDTYEPVRGEHNAEFNDQDLVRGEKPILDTSGSDVVPTPGTRKAPIKAETASDILDALPAEPKSPEQAEAENYKHAHVEIEHLGLVGKNSISIETGVGQERKGISPDGKEWSVTMPVAYGRIKGTKGGDGQPLDIFIGPDPKSSHVFVIDQHHDVGGGFDEHKILAGFPGPDAALRAFGDSYTDQGGNRIGHVTAMTPDDFQSWLKGDTTKPLKAAGSTGHHTQEPALDVSQSHHALGVSGNRTNEAEGGNPSQPVSSPKKYERPQSDSVKAENGASPSPHGHQDVIRAPARGRKAPPSQKNGEPQNLLQFIASRGGLKPHPELAVMDAHKHTVAMQGFPPRRRLVKDDGMELDRAREAAEEAGYFRGSHEGTSTVAEFLDAIDDGVNRKQHRYPEGHEGTKTKAEQPLEDERVAHEETRIQEFVDAIERTGDGEMAPEIKARALDLMHSTGLDASEAVETAVMQLTAEEKDVQAEFYAIYGHEVDDEIYAQAASGYGENLAREGSDGHGHEEAATGESGPGDAVAGGESGRTRNDAERAEPDTEGKQSDAGSSPTRAGRKGRAENPTEAERSKRSVAKEPTAAERKAAADAPTWAEILHELPMSPDGRTRQHEIAFDAITAMTGKKKPKYDDLTPEQKHELLAKLKAEKPVTTETGADNKPQMVMPGAEKASDGTMAKRAAAAPLKPKVAQKQADDGLFGGGHKQTDLLDMAAKKPEAPKDAFDDIFDKAMDTLPDLNIDDVAKGLGKLFGKGLSEPEAPFLDEAKYQQALPFFKAGVKHFATGNADLPTMVNSLVQHLFAAGMDKDAIRAMKPYIKRFTDDVTAGRETINAPSRSDVLESDRGNPAPENGVGQADVSAAAGPAGPSAGKRGGATYEGDQRPADSERLPQDHAPVVGASGNLELPPREPVDDGSDAGDRNDQRSGTNSEGGFSFDDGTTDEAVRNAQKDADLNARRERQRNAEGTKVIPGDISNIADTLPMLFPEQHDDVLKTEQRFAKPDGHGMLFTNGTGTGKTYSGLGVIKRFAMQGKTNTLVVAPSQGILMDWVRSAKDLGLDMKVLDSTMDNGGKGLVGTTYANLGDNRHVADRQWDLIVPDEAHKLSSDQDGTATKALKAMRALTLHPDGLHDRAKMVLRDLWDQIERMPEKDRGSAYQAFDKKAQPLIDKWKAEARPKALMMSATPFAYHFSLDYAQGYLFEYGGGNRTDKGYNSGDGRDHFFMQHLGYRMRINKLTKPDADVKSEVMERQLHEYLKKQGSLSGRALTVDKDYDRKFVLAHDAVGEQIDRALNFLQEAEDGRYRPLYDAISKQFDYLTRMRLLEAIKARAAVPYIQENLDLGRKIVVFHDYNEGGGINPFDLVIPPDTKTTTYADGKHVEVSVNDMYDDFRRQNPYIADLKFASYLPPIAELTKAFPSAMIYNGTVSNKIRNEAKRLFNDDNSGRDIIIVQSAAGEAGISLHDTTGKKQRVLLNLGMPIRPTSSIQQEGRIYRVGQSSDAIFRYMNTGTDWERWTFAGKIADRAGTAENLALGDQARTIRQSFIDAFSNAGDYTPEHGEGKGGKEADRAISHSMSEFEKAKTHYYAQQKVTGRRDQREGVDYYATPEPVGLKMVEFAGVRSGEKMLEPSAGHGAIARYFPEDTARTLVEPSSSLASRAALNSPGARVVVDRFENLDKGANKFDAIVMNPPFGTAGATAIEHLSKAMGHLKNGGRIVALIPRGSTDAKFNKLMDAPVSKDVYLVGDINLPPVTFERAGASISARIVVLEKQTDPEVRAKLQSKSRDYSDVTKIGELFDRIENAVLPDRLKPTTPDIDIPTTGNVTIGGVDFALDSSKRGDIHSATLKAYLGASKFRDVINAATETGGDYVKSAKRFDFKSEADRQRFFDKVAAPSPVTEAPSAPSGVTFKTGETIHAKTKAKLFVATANERVAGDVYSQMNAVAKANGGYYSSFKGNGAIPGFQFKSAEERGKFLAQMGLKEAKATDPFVPAGNFANYKGHPNSPAGARAQQFTLERGRKGTLDKQGIKRHNEQLVIIDGEGNVVGDIEGHGSGISFTPEIERVLHDPDSDLVVHHNHPKNRSFSATDIGLLAAPAVRTIYAHGHGGAIYRVNLTSEGRRALPVNVQTASQKLAAYAYAAEKGVQGFGVAHYEASGKSPVFLAAFEASWHHIANEILREAGIIEYETNFEPDPSITGLPNLDKAMKAAANVFREDLFRDQGQPAAGRHDRRPDSVRHPGNMGVSFDRAEVAATISPGERGDQARRGSDLREAGPAGLAEPSNTFKKPGSTDVALADILRTRVLGRLGDLNATEARTQLQDKFARLKNAEESVGAPSSQSAYQAESLYYGRTGQRLETLTEHHIDPLIREMKARDIDLDKLDEFLYARHAPERNQKLGRMYADKPTHDFYRAVHDPDVVGASGMSTNDALGVIRGIRAAGKLQDYLAIARMVDALNARTRRVLFDAGLIDRDTFDAWNSGYKYYVPLRGHAEGNEFMASGSGMNIRGKEAKTAFGRRSKADSPVAYTIMQAEMAIVRAEKNRVGSTFLQFVRANPDPARWTIDRPPLVKRIDPTTGLVTSVPDNLYANRDNVFTTKVDGRDVHITLHGPDGLNLARALKNMGTANIHALIRTYSAITHTMAKLATTFNPEFMIPNFARDFGEAFINLQAQQQRGFVRNFVGHIPGAMRGAMAAIAGRTPPPGSQLARYVDAFHEFDKAGGRIRFFGIDDPDAIETDVNRRLKRLEGGPVNTLKDIGDKAAKALEIAGGGIENATRLAAYMAARDAGFTPADAAMMARNLTVDFNKKGELGGVVSALYMFANAGVQGQARMVRALGSRRVWQAVAALAAAGALSSLFSVLASDTDETGIPDYMKIPSWERDKNLIFTLPGHYHLKMPLPYGFAPFAVIGSHAVTVAMGHEKPGKAASAIIDSILNAFNPLGEESTAWMDIVPSAIRPAFHIQFNKNWTGKPLYPDQDKNRGNRPDSTQAFKSNSAFSKEAAKQLDAWSGGSTYQPGAIDVHPASIDHSLQAITGGVGHFVKGIADSMYQNITGGEWQPEKMPIVRRFIGKVGPEADASLYYEKRQESLDEKAGVNAARKDLKGGNNTEEAKQFLAETPLTKAFIFKSADERIKALRANKSIAEPELREKIREVQNHARAQVQRLQPSP